VHCTALHCTAYCMTLLEQFTLCGHTTAQVISLWLLSMVDQVQSQLSSGGICSEKSGSGAGFHRVLWLPLSIPIPLNAPFPSFIIQGWSNGPCMPKFQGIQSQPTLRRKKKIHTVVFQVMILSSLPGRYLPHCNMVPTQKIAIQIFIIMKTSNLILERCLKALINKGFLQNNSHHSSTPCSIFHSIVIKYLGIFYISSPGILIDITKL
jgi:hypothetical protein